MRVLHGRARSSVGEVHRTERLQQGQGAHDPHRCGRLRRCSRRGERTVMSLNFRLHQIADVGTVCWLPDGRIRPVTQELIWNTIRIEMGCITEENADEFYARLKFMAALHGSMWKNFDGTDLEVTPEDVVAHIGLWTNVPEVHRQRWLTRSGGQVMGPIDADR